MIDMVPAATIEKVDAAVVAVAEAIVATAKTVEPELRPQVLIELTKSFRRFAEGVSLLVGGVPIGTQQETA